MTDADDISGRVHSLLSEAMPGDVMVTKYTAAVEVIEASGERAIWLLASEGTKESIGMLEYALAVERSEMVAETFKEEGE